MIICNFIMLCKGGKQFMKYKIDILFCLFLVIGCSQPPTSLTIKNKNPDISANDILDHIKYLSADERQGRFPGSEGSKESVEYIVNQFKSAGIEPAGTDGYNQFFDFTIGIKLSGKNSFSAKGSSYNVSKDYIPLEFSSNGVVSSDLTFVGYGYVIDDSLDWNDYNNINVENRWVMIIRGGPDGDHPHSKFVDHNPLRKKAMLARDNKAAGVLFVDSDEGGQLISLKHTPNSTAIGIPVIHITRTLANMLLEDKLELFQTKINESQSPYSMEIDTKIKVQVSLEKEKVSVPNVLGVLQGSDPRLKNEYIVVGAHFDHLGFGGAGSGSLSQNTREIHNGADDNASGTAGVLEIAAKLSSQPSALKRSVIFMAYNAEEEGLLGSKYFVDNPTIDLTKITAMINMDMIGRMSDNKVTIGGIGTSPSFKSILDQIELDHEINIRRSSEGYGPSDHASFYVNNIPVLFFFTGTHTDYHKPSDDWEHINAEGTKQILDIVHDIIYKIDSIDDQLVFTEAGPKGPSQSRRSFKVTLGVIPSYGSDAEGLEIDGARPDGPAGKAGLKKGDILIEIDGKEIKNIYDYMYRLGELKPGESINIKVRRGERIIDLTVNL